MRLSFIIFLIAINCAWGNKSYSQKTELSFNMRNTAVIDVLDEIEDNSEFYFLYSNKLIDVNRKVNISVKKKKIEHILSDLFRGTDVNYLVMNRQIVLSHKDYLNESAGSMQQQIRITGTVTDAQTGEPLPGVNIIIVGTNKGATTNMDGKYTIEATPDGSLGFSFVGYRERTVQINGREEINVSLELSVTELEEVVAIGYGTRERGELTGSVANIDGTNLEQVPVSNISKSLQGRMPGLIINDRGGEPGKSNIDLTIRGSHTLGDNSPLIIIDGVPREDFGKLSPHDIEDISVLKDASAAIYGARAANGVIVIRTKRGKKGAPTIRLTSSYGVSKFTKIPDYMNSWQYATFRNEISERFGGTGEFSQADIEKYKSGDYPVTHPNTDWFKETYRQFAPQTHHNLSASGGNEDITFFISGDYLHEDGHYESDVKKYDQYGIRSNIDANVWKYLDIGFDLYGRLEKDHSIASTGKLFERLTRNVPTQVGYLPNGLVGYTGDIGETPIKLSSEAAGYSDEQERTFNSKLSFDFSLDWLTEGLSVLGYGAFDFIDSETRRHQKPYTVWSYDEANDEYIEHTGYSQSAGEHITLGQRNNVWQSNLLHFRLSYDNSFGDHNVNAFAAYEQSETFSNFIYGYRQDLYSEEKVELFAGAEEGRVINGSSSQTGRINYFGSFSYNYMSKYLIDFTLRRDGSFNFAEDKRFGTFPGISVGWRISEEEFMSGIGLLNNLKLRASYAQMGNDRVPSYQYLTKYELQGYYIFGESLNYYDGMDITSTPNPAITWEVSNNTNVGFDATFLNRLFSLSFDYFYEQRRQILITT